MANNNIVEHGIDASPVKSFFVEMLTRDIELEDAILDLLDNCIDGVARLSSKSDTEKPYKGFWAEITFDENKFEIKDNCGGIPKELSEYAFRMGRPNDNINKNKKTVGTYGIGMKRAIFKIGRKCSVITSTVSDNYEVVFTPEWMQKEGDWRLPRNFTGKKLDYFGTKIIIENIHKAISKQFIYSEGFSSNLVSTIKSHYAVIIQKGFKVTVNNKVLDSRPVKLLFSDIDNPKKKGDHIRPYIYTATVDDVNIFLAVGFTAPPPSTEELDDDQKERKWSSNDAGWTVICNDRVVLYADKSKLTGWGEAGVANYHTQFITISGIVEFSSDNPRNLPMTTTKRGIDGNSDIYLSVKDKMREGLKKFINYTNKWKGLEKESRQQLKNIESVDLKEIKSLSTKISLSSIQKGIGGKQSTLSLPLPKKETDDVRITFTRRKKEIQRVANYLFGESDSIKPSEVGEKCFEYFLEEAGK